MTTAVLARVERIEPQPDGGGMLRYRGPHHLFNSQDFNNSTGRIRAWCGTSVASVDLSPVEDRPAWGGLYANLCRRCFVEPRRKKDGAA